MSDDPGAPQKEGPGPLWMHFTEMADYRSAAPRTIVRGEGAYVWDAGGKRYFDGLSGLYCSNVGHGRAEIADAVRDQLMVLDYFPVWNYSTPRATELAARIAELAPADLNWSFFTSGGSEAVESAWKLTRQFHSVRGNPGKTKIISRAGSYHGTTFGALSITGSPSIRSPFEPLVPGALHAPKVDPFHSKLDPEAHSIECADAVEAMVEAEGADTVGAVIVEPVQNSGGCLVADPAYFRRLREICDRHDLLLISDETICAWGRLGTFFGSDKIGYRPDIITTAKALTSAYVPMGALIASDRVMAPFQESGKSFAHGLTFGGHPAAAAAALTNIAIIEREGLCSRAEAVGEHFRDQLETLRAIPMVGDIRGIGLFQGIEIAPEGDPDAKFAPKQTEFLAGFVPQALFERGLICRALHRGAPVLQFSPPLISTKEDITTAVDAVRDVLTEAQDRLPKG